MPPLVVCSSIGVPPPFMRPSKRRRDFSVTSTLRSGETLTPPFVHVADRSAFAFCGRLMLTPPLVVFAEIGSRPTDAKSMLTMPFVDRASTPPERPLPVTAPLVVRAITLPPSPRSEEHTSELQSPCNLVCR